MQSMAQFLEEKISFLKIGELVSKALELPIVDIEMTVPNVYAVDKMARDMVMQNIQ